MLLRIVAKALLHRKNRVIVAMTALIVGAGISAALLSVYYDAGRKMNHELRRYGANLVVTPLGQSTSIDESIAADLSNSTWSCEIAGAAPFLYVAASAAGPAGSRTSLIVNGTRIDQFRKTNPWIGIKGRWVEDPAVECVVGAQVARVLGATEGDRIQLFGIATEGQLPAAAKTATPQRDGKNLTVVGVLTSGSDEDNQILMPLDAVQRMSALPHRISAIAVSAVGQTAAIERLATEFAERFPETRVRPIRQIAESEGRVLSRIRLMMLLVTIVVLAAAALSTSTTLTALIIERRPEIGTMKAIGAEDRKLTNIFLLELGAIGLVCGLVGYGVGLALAQLVGRSLFASNVAPRLAVFVSVVALTLGVALLSGLVPVRRIRQVDPASILKSD